MLTTTDLDVPGANVPRKLDDYHAPIDKQKDAEDKVSPPMESNAYTGDDDDLK